MQLKYFHIISKVYRELKTCFVVMEYFNHESHRGETLLKKLQER